MRKDRKTNSYFRAVILLAILIMVYLLYNNLLKEGIPGGLAGLLNTDFERYRDLTRFEEKEQEEIRKEFAGFWEFSEGDPSIDPISKTERLELIDNGIVWHVINWHINLPSGEQAELIHGRHAYYTPFSYCHDTAQIFSEAVVVRQAFITDNDTCYGESHDLEMWEMVIVDEKLSFNNRLFSAYHGELVDFFKDNNILTLIERIDLEPCSFGTSLSSLGRTALKENRGEVGEGKREAIITSMIEKYYKPLIIDEKVRSYDSRTVPDSVDLTLTVCREGNVTNLRNHSVTLTTNRFNTALNKEIERWVFPSSKNEETFSITVSVK